MLPAGQVGSDARDAGQQLLAGLMRSCKQLEAAEHGIRRAGQHLLAPGGGPGSREVGQGSRLDPGTRDTGLSRLAAGGQSLNFAEAQLA